MTEPTSADDPTGGGHPGLPRWVKVSAVIVVLTIGLAIVATLVLGADHGPDRHGPDRHEPDRHGAGLAPAQVMPG